MLTAITKARLNIHCSFLGAVLVSALGLGCASTGGSDNGASASASEPATSTSRTQQTINEAERRFVIGPVAASEFDYTVQWQSPNSGRNARLFKAQGDSVFVLDDQNYLTRLDRESGRRIWRTSAAEPVQEIISINYIGDRVYLISGGRIIELDADSGAQVGLQRLEKIANTPPVELGQFLVYGSRDGQIIWHSYEVSYQWRAYQISPSIRLKPLYIDGYLVTVGNDGRVAVHNASNASMLWDKRLLDAVEAPPAAGNGAVYVAGLDQHLWAYDLRSGRNIWRHLTESPLRQAPVLINDHVYQQIPEKGLVCFEALPLDSPGGEINWEADDIRGEVLAARNSRLLVWAEQDGQLTIADEQRGGVIQTLNLRQTDKLYSSDLDGGELFAVNNDGRVVRLLAEN